MPHYVIPSGQVLTTGDFLDSVVRKVMSPGVVAISEHASLDHAYNAIVAHRIHAVLVVSGKDAQPLGWTTARGMLGYADRDRSLLTARDAITEEPRTIGVRSTVRDAIDDLTVTGATHLLVVEDETTFPIGVVSDLDLAAFLGHRSG